MNKRWYKKSFNIKFARKHWHTQPHHQLPTASIAFMLYQKGKNGYIYYIYIKTTWESFITQYVRYLKMKKSCTANKRKKKTKYSKLIWEEHAKWKDGWLKKKKKIVSP